MIEDQELYNTKFAIKLLFHRKLKEWQWGKGGEYHNPSWPMHWWSKPTIFLRQIFAQLQQKHLEIFVLAIKFEKQIVKKMESFANLLKPQNCQKKKT